MLAQICVRRNQREAGAFRQGGHPLARKSQAPYASTLVAGWCPVPEITSILPGVSWLFFKARAKRPYLNHTGRACNTEKQPTGPGPEGCDENGPSAALVVGHVSI
jgi:hypothetical protein